MDSKSSNNDKKRNRVLFDFESLIDIKLSYAVDCMKKKNKSLSDGDIQFLKTRRMYDSEKDVLDGLIPEGETIESLDLLHPKGTLVFTGMQYLMNQYMESSGGLIRCTVLCKDSIQERIIKDNFKNPRVLVADRNNVKTINFSRIVLGQAIHTLEFRNPVTVDFMILNFRENFDKYDIRLLPKDVLVKIGDVNTFSIVKTYPEISDPVG